MLPCNVITELNMEPLSPTRPLTLDPETGKRLMRAEGEPTPQPTPEPSPEPSPVPSPVPVQVMCKEETEGLVRTTFSLFAIFLLVASCLKLRTFVCFLFRLKVKI